MRCCTVGGGCVHSPIGLEVVPRKGQGCLNDYFVRFAIAVSGFFPCHALSLELVRFAKKTTPLARTCVSEQRVRVFVPTGYCMAPAATYVKWQVAAMGGDTPVVEIVCGRVARRAGTVACTTRLGACRKIYGLHITHSTIHSTATRTLAQAGRCHDHVRRTRALAAAT